MKIFKVTIFLFILSVTYTVNSYGQTPLKYKENLKPYVEFLGKQKTSPKDYIFSLYKECDLILLCERFHAEITQYDFILDMIADPRFSNQVSTIYIEIGGKHLTPMVDAFFAMKNLSDEKLEKEAVKILREAHWRTMWTRYSYVKFLKGMYRINQTLPENNKIRVVLCDYPLDWSGIKTKEDYPGRFPQRDSIMANTIITSFDSITNSNSKRKKGLAILNSIHAFTNQTWIKGTNIKPDWVNAGMIIRKEYGLRVQNILINSIIDAGEESMPFQKGRWDAAFKIAGNPCVGFSFKGSPFGTDDFDMRLVLSNLQYQDVFTGMIFYKPINEHYHLHKDPSFVTPDFMPEMVRRHEIAGFPTDTTVIKKWYNYRDSASYRNLDKMEIIINSYVNKDE